ncbi:MAG: zinc-ribbon domain-containing protein, partial [Butyricicoccus pullicaecorum]|nr:zinc-ribbon domain-containing protein [Butyricicoccus pullicaecorum]
MRETLYDFCIRTGQQTLLQEWDAKRNAPLTPKDLSYGSKKKVWWRCAHGHVWQAMVTIRTANHSGCPYCSHQRPWPGENDLKTL